MAVFAPTRPVFDPTGPKSRSFHRSSHVQALLVEASLRPQGPADGHVNDRLRHKVVVIQVCEGRIKPVDPSVSLVPVTVRVRLRVENHRIRGDTVPTFCASPVLNQVQPALSGWNFFVFVPVPLSDRER